MIYPNHQFLPTFFTLLSSCIAAGGVHAQSIHFTGDTNPTGDLGAVYSSDNITVGNTADGSLNISSGAVLTTTNMASIAATATSSGTATVSDPGSLWNVRTVGVGRLGQGTLNIRNEGKIISREGYIGQLAGSTGTVTVDGKGTSWTIPLDYNGDFWIGNMGGAGTLTVSNGATVSTTSDIYTAVSGSNVSALVQVDGMGSTLNADALCYLGMSGTSTVHVTNGAEFNCGGQSFINFGTVSVTGQGSKWTLGSTLSIGNSSNLSNGALTVGDGGTVEVSSTVSLPYIFSATANSTGTLNIEGTSQPGAFSAPSLAFGSNNLGTVNFNHTDDSGDYIFSTPMSGPGTVNINGSGITSLSGTNVYSGTTDIKAGVLRAASTAGLSNASDFVLHSGGTLDSNTFSPTVKSLVNGGVVTMLSGGTAGALTVNRNYVGNGGTVALNTALGDSTAATERLLIQGDTSGTTTLDIHNLGGSGAQTTGNGILVVQVAGTSDGLFKLPAPGFIDVGSYRYTLLKVGRDWYLQSEGLAAAPEANVVCVPAELVDADNQVSTCTVTLNSAPLQDLPVNLNVAPPHARYTTSCVSPIVVPAHSTQSTCTVTAVSNNVAGDGDVIAEMSVAAPTLPGAYTTSGPAAQVLIKDDDAPSTATAVPVPQFGWAGLVSLSALLSVFAFGQIRHRRPRQ